MVKFKIITDSSCGITQEEATRYGIKVLPLTLHYKQKDYLDGIDISTDDFYGLLFESSEKKDLKNLIFNSEKKEFPKTSQVPPLEFKKAFEECIENHEIPIVLPIASVLSGTYQSACIARDMLEDKEIYVIDSKTALGCLKIMIMSLQQKKFETIDDVLKEIDYMIQHIAFYSVPDTLEYLYKGGRLSKTSAVLGNLLQLKPIIKLSEVGKLEPIAKVRGLKHAFMKIADAVKEEPIDTNYPVDFGFSNHIENVEELKGYLKDFLPDKYTTTQISPVVGAHVGPGASAIFYISTKAKNEK